MLRSVDSAVSVDSEKSPVAKSIIPILPRIPGWMRSTRYPAVGAVIRVAIGHGVSSKPVRTSLCPQRVLQEKRQGNHRQHLCGKRTDGSADG